MNKKFKKIIYVDWFDGKAKVKRLFDYESAGQFLAHNKISKLIAIC